MASAMFTVYQSILLKKFPVQDQDRLVELRGVGKGAAAKEFPLNFNQYPPLSRGSAHPAGHRRL